MAVTGGTRTCAWSISGGQQDPVWLAQPEPCALSMPFRKSYPWRGCSGQLIGSWTNSLMQQGELQAMLEGRVPLSAASDSVAGEKKVHGGLPRTISLPAMQTQSPSASLEGRVSTALADAASAPAVAPMQAASCSQPEFDSKQQQQQQDPQLPDLRCGSAPPLHPLPAADAKQQPFDSGRLKTSSAYPESCSPEWPEPVAPQGAQALGIPQLRRSGGREQFGGVSHGSSCALDALSQSGSGSVMAHARSLQPEPSMQRPIHRKQHGSSTALNLLSQSPSEPSGLPPPAPPSGSDGDPAAGSMSRSLFGRRLRRGVSADMSSWVPRLAESLHLGGGSRKESGVTDPSAGGSEDPSASSQGGRSPLPFGSPDEMPPSPQRQAEGSFPRQHFLPPVSSSEVSFSAGMGGAATAAAEKPGGRASPFGRRSLTVAVGPSSHSQQAGSGLISTGGVGNPFAGGNWQPFNGTPSPHAAGSADIAPLCGGGSMSGELGGVSASSGGFPGGPSGSRSSTPALSRAPSAALLAEKQHGSSAALEVLCGALSESPDSISGSFGPQHSSGARKGAMAAAADCQQQEDQSDATAAAAALQEQWRRRQEEQQETAAEKQQAAVKTFLQQQQRQWQPSDASAADSRQPRIVRSPRRGSRGGQLDLLNAAAAQLQTANSAPLLRLPASSSGGSSAASTVSSLAEELQPAGGGGGPEWGVGGRSSSGRFGSLSADWAPMLSGADAEKTMKAGLRRGGSWCLDNLLPASGPPPRLRTDSDESQSQQQLGSTTDSTPRHPSRTASPKKPPLPVSPARASSPTPFKLAAAAAATAAASECDDSGRVRKVSLAQPQSPLSTLNAAIVEEASSGADSSLRSGFGSLLWPADADAAVAAGTSPASGSHSGQGSTETEDSASDRARHGSSHGDGDSTASGLHSAATTAVKLVPRIGPDGDESTKGRFTSLPTHLDSITER